MLCGTSKRFRYTPRLVLAAAGFVAANLIVSSAFATTYACWFQADTLKLKRTLAVPADKQVEFMSYLRKEVTDGRLSRSEVESDNTLALIFQNVEAGILAITIEYSKSHRVVTATVESCDFKEDWKPYWHYVKAKIDAFGHPLR